MHRLSPKQSIASFDVDAQNGFTPLCPDELPVPEGHLIVDELNHQATLAQYRLGSKDAHCPQAIWKANAKAPPLTPIEGDHVDVHWPLHCVPGTKGFELINGLPHPSQYSFFVYKGVEPDMHPYGACFHDHNDTQSTGVIEFLHAKNVKTVIVGGLALEYCLKKTVEQLLTAGFSVIVNLGASRGLEKQSTRDAIQNMQSKGAIMVESSQQLASI